MSTVNGSGRCGENLSEVIRCKVETNFSKQQRKSWISNLVCLIVGKMLMRSQLHCSLITVVLHFAKSKAMEMGQVKVVNIYVITHS